MKTCKNCGKEIEDKAVFCIHCGVAVKAKKPIFKKWWFWVIIVVLVVGIIAGSSSGDSTNIENESGEVQNQLVETQKPSVPEEFAGELPVSISLSIEDNVIGYPELIGNIKNNSNKEIAAIQLYFVPVDVYGDEVDTIFTSNKLYTDKGVAAKSSYNTRWSLLDKNIKAGEIYIYSVFFADGTEWGDKDASVTRIKKYGYKISVES